MIHNFFKIFLFFILILVLSCQETIKICKTSHPGLCFTITDKGNEYFEVYSKDPFQKSVIKIGYTEGAEIYICDEGDINLYFLYGEIISNEDVDSGFNIVSSYDTTLFGHNLLPKKVLNSNCLAYLIFEGRISRNSLHFTVDE